MSRYNHLGVEIYSSGLTHIIDARAELRLAQDIEFSTFYPGGLYGDCSFFLPRRPLGWFPTLGGKRLVLRNGRRIAWEGRVDIRQDTLDAISQGNAITGTGMWGTDLMRDGLRRYYVDTRVDEDAWQERTTPDKQALSRVSRQNDTVDN